MGTIDILVQQLMYEKANSNNSIDLDSYGSGLIDMLNVLKSKGLVNVFQNGDNIKDFVHHTKIISESIFVAGIQWEHNDHIEHNVQLDKFTKQ